MSIKPNNRYIVEKAANEKVKVVLNNLTAEKHIHPNDVYTVHNVYSGTGKDDPNKQGADITTRCNTCGLEINYDIKYAPKLRDNPYDTVLLELATYAYDQSNGLTYWQQGWVYNQLCQYVVWCVPIDGGYENGDMSNYVMYICKKEKIKKVCEEIIHADEIVYYAENEDMWVRRNKWVVGKWRYELDDQVPIQLTYEAKTNTADGLLLVTNLADLMATGILVVNNQVRLVTDNFDTINRKRQKFCMQYRAHNNFSEKT